MEPTITTGLQNTYHDDGTVSYWDVYQQQWQRELADDIPDRVLASMSEDERQAVREHAIRPRLFFVAFTTVTRRE